MRLVFDEKAFMNDLIVCMKTAIEQVQDRFYKEAVQGLSSTDNGKEDVKIENDIISAKCWFHAFSILESYGIGLGADTSSSASYWGDYAGKSPAWNPLRTSKQIVGRQAGTYENIFGNSTTSKGRFAGRSLNQPYRKAKMSIQKAEDWIIKDGKTYMERTIETELEKFFSDMQKNSGRYFRYG